MKWLALIFLFFMVGCGRNYVVNETSFFVMDTYVNVKIYNKEKNNQILEEIKQLFVYYDCLFDRYNPCEGVNNVYSINNMATDFLEIDDEIIYLIDYGLDFNLKSNGFFDQEIGDLIDVWKEAIETGDDVPSYEELLLIEKKNLKLVDNKIYQGINLDLGAIAKGYTLDRVKAYLDEEGFDKYIINAGGQVLVGNSYRKNPYKIGIKHPSKNINMAIVNGENISVSTSGSYERFVEIKGVSYNHIINPKTLFPGDYYASVTVIAKNGMVADVLTTILFLMPIEEGLEFIKNYEAEAIWYLNDEQIIRSQGFSLYE